MEVYRWKDILQSGHVAVFDWSKALGERARFLARCFSVGGGDGVWLDLRYAERTDKADVGFAFRVVSLVSTKAMISVTGLIWIRQGPDALQPSWIAIHQGQ